MKREIRRRMWIRKMSNAGVRKEASSTFFQRRRRLFKNSEELSILCDVDVALIVFSSTGKLFQFASSSMKHILAKRRRCWTKLNIIDPSPSITKLQNAISLLRQVNLDGLEDLSIGKLQELENDLEAAHLCVVRMKEKLLKKQIANMQKRGVELMANNAQLRHQLLTPISDGKSLSNGLENLVSEDGENNHWTISNSPIHLTKC